MCGLVIFGGTDPETGFVVTVSAFDTAFCAKYCKKAWEVVGACPLTMACLSDPKVRREIGDADDATNEVLRALQAANDLAVYMANDRGYDGNLFAAKLAEPERTRPVTVKHSQARVEALAKASTHGAKFTATGGFHLTSNDMFKSMEIAVREKEIKEAEKEKERRLKMVEWMVKGKAALARVDGDFRKLKANELVALLRWYSVPAAEVGKKEDNFLMWMEMCGDDEPADVSWLDSDERKLEELRTKETEMVDTALGRLQERKKRELRAAIPTMSIAEILEIEAEIAEAKAAEPGAALVPI